MCAGSSLHFNYAAARVPSQQLAFVAVKLHSHCEACLTQPELTVVHRELPDTAGDVP
jgi:hypothetical protein